MLTGIQTTTSEHPHRRELEQLLLQLGSGDREALRAIYQRTRGAVYALALGLLKNTQDAQDATQETYIHLWQGAEQYRPQGSPMGWILTICRNLALEQLRRRERLGQLSDEEWDAIPAGSSLPPEERQILQEALANLADQERQILLLHAAAGLRHREIAALLQLPLGTVLSKYQRARKKCKASLEGDDTL